MGNWMGKSEACFPAGLSGCQERVVNTMEFIHTIDMPGRWYTELFEVASGQYGYVTADDVRALGGKESVLVDMERHGHLDRHARGLYRFRSYPADPRDEFMAATLWPRGLGVISHDSALDLWNLCDVNPIRIHVTVPRRERVRRQTPSTYEVHVRDLDRGDVTNLDGIPVVTPRRAILDGVDRHLDDRLIRQALDAARRRGLVASRELAELRETIA
jgi:predicted transcriptional regulator of viral defense system